NARYPVGYSRRDSLHKSVERVAHAQRIVDDDSSNKRSAAETPRHQERQRHPYGLLSNSSWGIYDMTRKPTSAALRVSDGRNLCNRCAAFLSYQLSSRDQHVRPVAG